MPMQLLSIIVDHFFEIHYFFFFDATQNAMYRFSAHSTRLIN